MNTQTNFGRDTITSVTQRLTDKLYRLGLRQTNHDVWTWAGNGCILNVTLQNGENGVLARAEWTDGRCADVVFLDDAKETRDLLLWLDWYVSGNGITEQGTIGYVAQAA